MNKFKKDVVLEEPVILEEKKEEPVVLEKKEEPVVIEEKKEEPVEKKEEPVIIEKKLSEEEELELAIKNFSNNTSNHEVKEEPVVTEEKKEVKANTISGEQISPGDAFKIGIFTKVAFLLLDGFHIFVYGFFYKKHKISKDDLELDEDDKEGIEDYFKTKEVVDFINKLPTWVLGLIHVEYLYYNKFSEWKKDKEEEEKKKPLRFVKKKIRQEEEEEQEEEQEEEEQEEQPRKKRKYRKTGKYSKKKKKPVKKSKTEKKDE